MERKLHMFMSTWKAGCGRVFGHSKMLCMCMLALECILTNSMYNQLILYARRSLIMYGFV